MMLTPPWIDGVYWTLAIEIVFYFTIFAAIWARTSDFLDRCAGILAIASAALPQISNLTLASHGNYLSCALELVD
jgi:hypothetical protein